MYPTAIYMYIPSCPCQLLFILLNMCTHVNVPCTFVHAFEITKVDLKIVDID